MTAPDLTYLSLGAGVQSSALLVASCLGLHGVPRADVAIFADTQCEPPHVYEAVARLRAWAATHGLEVVTVSAGNLLDQAVARMRGYASRYSSIPTWVKGSDGKAAPGRRQCTKDFKILPIEREVRRRLGYEKGQRVKKTARALIGISVDEYMRMKPNRTPWITNQYPLVDARLTRAQCATIVTDAGLPMPKKSACTFCPYHDDRMWLEMKTDDPVSFEAACVADELLRDQRRAGLNEFAYVHRSLMPLREIDFAALCERKYATPLFGDAGGFGNECEGMCGV